MNNKLKKCPFCGANILSVAMKCRFCGDFIQNKSAYLQQESTGKPSVATAQIFSTKTDELICFKSSPPYCFCIIMIILGLMIIGLGIWGQSVFAIGAGSALFLYVSLRLWVIVGGVKIDAPKQLLEFPGGDSLSLEIRNMSNWYKRHKIQISVIQKLVCQAEADLQMHNFKLKIGHTNTYSIAITDSLGKNYEINFLSEKDRDRCFLLLCQIRSEKSKISGE